VSLAMCSGHASFSLCFSEINDVIECGNGLSFCFKGISLLLFATASVDGQFRDIFLSSHDDVAEIYEMWLSDVNAYFADKSVSLASIFQFLETSFPHRKDSDKDTHGILQSDDEDDGSMVGEFTNFQTWCRSQGLPELDWIQSRYHPVSSQNMDLGSQVDDSILQHLERARLAPLPNAAWVEEISSFRVHIGRGRDLFGNRNIASEVGIGVGDLLVAILCLDEAQLTPHLLIQTADGCGEVRDALLQGIAQRCFNEETQEALQASSSGMAVEVAVCKIVLPRTVDFIDTLKSMAEQCPACFSKHGSATRRLRCCPCKKELCWFQYLERRSQNSLASELQDYEVVSLHLTLASAGLQDPTTFEPFPPQLLLRNEIRSHSGIIDEPFRPTAVKNKDIARARQLLASLPPAKVMSEASWIREANPCQESYNLLRFILSTCPLVIKKVTDPDALLKGLPDSFQQFAVVHGSPEADERFEELASRHGIAFGFHGSPLSKWYSILRNGLRNMSDTRLMTNGAVLGAGVYLAKNLQTAHHYCSGFAGSSYGVQGQQIRVVAIVEYVNDPALQHHSLFSDEILFKGEVAGIRLRYLLVESAGTSGITSMTVDRLDVPTRLARFCQKIFQAATS